MSIKDNLKKYLKKPLVETEITYEQFNSGVERFYYWLLEFVGEGGLGYDLGKTKEEVTASEMSAFWGVLEQRKSIQQEKAAQYLGTIGGMIKSMFQILRSLRIMDERYRYYEDAKKGDKAAEIALKGIWVDMVEGGAKNPASVYGLATQVGFTILPDLFFEIMPPPSAKDESAIYAWIDKNVDTNPKVKQVLSRKLYQYVQWRNNTEKEIRISRTFHLKYLRQHFDTIHLYISWVKPYLKNIPRLQTKQEKLPHLLSFSEGAVIELELFGVKWQKEEQVRYIKGEKQEPKKLKYHPAFLIEFSHGTRPMIAYQEEYQRGAIHTGRTQMKMSVWVLTEEIYNAVKKEQEKEDMEIINSLFGAMGALEEELTKYLEEAGEIKKKEEQAKQEGKSAADILFEPIKFLAEPFKALLGTKPVKKEEGEPEKITPESVKMDTWENRKQYAAAETLAKDSFKATRSTVKDAFQMINW